MSPCPFRKSYPDVLVMQPSQDWNGENGARSWTARCRAHLSVMPSACALDCNTPHRRKEFAAGGMHRQIVWLSRRLFRQQSSEGLFPLFGRLCHALKKVGRALYRPSPTGTVDLPPPRLRRGPSSLHDERKIGWVKFFTHAP